ncbi:MAG: ATPase, T2SS/T4P/T4SS family [Chloroflexi bacterium]|nr:ATPase, T2SS/T4P/T4SS family [Chloroflexota bacterium]
MSTIALSAHYSYLGELLVEARLISEDQLKQAMEKSEETNRELNDILLDSGLIKPQQLALFKSIFYNVPFTNLQKYIIDPEIVNIVPEKIARKFCAIPIEMIDDTLVVAMDNPADLDAINALQITTRKSIKPVVSLIDDILEAIERYYKSGGEIEKQLNRIPSRIATALNETQDKLSAEAIAQAPIVRAIDLLLKQAVKDRASDIHIEPQEGEVKVRFRIDGILHEIITFPSRVHPALVSRIKIMAGLNIAERRRPQDGQISLRTEDKQIDIRVGTSNTVNGEMVVLRILDSSFALLSLEQVGFSADTLSSYTKMLKTPFGMVLLSGPTGSGKTTTLYASINQLDKIGRNIITIEDPVEYHFNNINQMQVNTQAGVTFAFGLRACMRLDPNIILVGEIRDTETAHIAIQAANTGHLVLSSVHANDTAGVIFRLIDLGAESFLVASAIVGIIAQRMVRRVCPKCAKLVPASSEEKLIYEKEMLEGKNEFLYGSGCNTCANTGYKGRTAIFEVMTISENIRRLIMNNASADEIRNQAYKEGMKSLWHDGMQKVKMGITTPYEVQRNVFSIS